MEKNLVIKEREGVIYSVVDSFASIEDAYNVAAAYNNKENQRYTYRVAVVRD